MTHWEETLFWDLETFSAGRELELGPDKFVRQMQYAFGDDEVKVTYDRQEMLEIVRSAKWVCGHNIISADLTWLFGYESLEPLYMAMDRKVIDTFYLANLLTPAPSSFTMRNGRRVVETTSPVGHAMTWLSLDNLCFQFGLAGKMGDLKELAKKYNPPKTRVADLDFGLIPLDDPEFLEYAEQDVIAVRDLYNHLLNEIKEQGYPGDYIWREMELMSATVGQMHRNGIKVNQEYMNQVIEERENRKEEILDWLVREYDFPMTGKSPWSSDEGKQVIFKVLADFGITEQSHPDWERTATGNLSLGSQALKDLVEDASEEAQEFVEALSELKGMRPIAQQVKDSMKPDGRVHPDITALQRSGRWSFTNPGITVIGERNERLRQDKRLFTAEEGNVLAGFDYSSADARAMAALSGDHEFALRFATDEEGNDLYDSHNLTGEASFGKEHYYPEGMEPSKSARPPLRDVAKIVTHSTNYNVGAYKLAVEMNKAAKREGLNVSFWAPEGRTGKPIEKLPGAIHTRDLLDKFHDTYRFLKAFKDKAVREAEIAGYVTNSWGRRMAVSTGREYTQGPALHGQSVTREQMGDAILRLIRKGEYYIRSLRAIIHDELLLEFQEDRIEGDEKVVRECMEREFTPHTAYGFPINFPVGSGYGRTWFDAGH